ncbi:MAG: glycoside hydrolase TIM-barrel-like domain-containing protein, partial [Rickettsiales bacterium]|nr:glycoside hydrolase TIM-barrel-like domain-containing protein [Rickettsiales bacterium]
PEYGLKRIEYWWSHEHWSNGLKTSWQPKMKPIWFTEFGFPSMNKSVNVPYETYDPKSGKKPKHTSGNPDFALQIRAIRATLEYWRNKSDVVQNTFLWAWDVRPFPYFPQRLDLWSDGDQWSRGHWINGKIDVVSQVKFLPNIDVCNLKTNANTTIIDGYYNRIKNIDAPSTVYTAKGAKIISKVLSLGCN